MTRARAGWPRRAAQDGAAGRLDRHRGRGARQEPHHPVRQGPRDPDPSPDARLVASLPTGRAVAATGRPGPPGPRGSWHGRRLLRRAGGRAPRDAGRGPPPDPGRASARTSSPTISSRTGRTEALRRLRDPARAGRTIAEALLDQRALAGIGNVYKSEVLYLERVDPWRPVGEIDDATLGRLVDTAHRLLVLNADPRHGPERVTTGRAPAAAGQALWVYGRAGRPCRRCGALIRRRAQGTRDCPAHLLVPALPACRMTVAGARGGHTARTGAAGTRAWRRSGDGRRVTG